MKSSRLIYSIVSLCVCGPAAQHAEAVFHLMQIEQVIGGVNGDTTAQAIQLRIRNNGQFDISQAKLVVRDAAGLNPVTLFDITTDITSGEDDVGDRLLFTTTNFGDHTNVALVSDFTLTNPIPASYLAAGRLTFERDNGTIYWSLSWGGASYTGPTNGIVNNDADGDAGPAFASALPSTTLQALQFQGAATALSVSNATDYAITAGASVWINNAAASFTLVDPPPPDSADFDDDDDVDGIDFLTWQQSTGGPGVFEDGDANHDGNIDGDDLAIWETQYNTPPPLSGVTAVPEPGAVAILVCGLLAVGRRCR